MDHERDFGNRDETGDLGPWWCWVLLYIGILVIGMVI